MRRVEQRPPKGLEKSDLGRLRVLRYLRIDKLYSLVLMGLEQPGAALGAEKALKNEPMRPEYRVGR